MIRALPPCDEAYRGVLIYDEEYDPGPDTRTTVGSFRVSVAADGSLAITGMDLRLEAALGAALAAVGVCGHWLLRNS
jgi:hypothetical protein